MKATGIFKILLSYDGGLERTISETNFQKTMLKVSFKKITVQDPIAEHWTVISDPLIKYQLRHTRFDEISNHKHNIYLNGKLSTKLLAQAANKYIKINGKILNKHFDRFKSNWPETRFTIQNSHSQNEPPKVFYKKAVNTNFVILAGKHPCRRLFSIKLQAFRRPATLFKRDFNTCVILWLLQNY